jgi:hypothetical protein
LKSNLNEKPSLNTKNFEDLNEMEGKECRERSSSMNHQSPLKLPTSWNKFRKSEKILGHGRVLSSKDGVKNTFDEPEQEPSDKQLETATTKASST